MMDLDWEQVAILVELLRSVAGAPLPPVVDQFLPDVPNAHLMELIWLLPAMR